jgi:hypothetical protein
VFLRGVNRCVRVVCIPGVHLRVNIHMPPSSHKYTLMGALWEKDRGNKLRLSLEDSS